MYATDPDTTRVKSARVTVPSPSMSSGSDPVWLSLAVTAELSDEPAAPSRSTSPRSHPWLYTCR